ncbi:hypothetical protein AgCh_027944 [Apium graveolens]
MKTNAPRLPRRYNLKRRFEAFEPYSDATKEKKSFLDYIEEDLKLTVAKHDIESLKVLKLVKLVGKVPTYQITFEAPLLAETEGKCVETFETEICMPSLSPTIVIELKSDARVISVSCISPQLETLDTAAIAVIGTSSVAAIAVIGTSPEFESRAVEDWGCRYEDVEKGLTVLLEWGSPWDKRMLWEGWIAWARVLLMKAKKKSWPQTSWCILNLGLVR